MSANEVPSTDVPRADQLNTKEREIRFTTNFHARIAETFAELRRYTGSQIRKPSEGTIQFQRLERQI